MGGDFVVVVILKAVLEYMWEESAPLSTNSPLFNGPLVTGALSVEFAGRI